MKNLQQFQNIKVTSTKECVDFLNQHYKVGKWKRKSKFMENESIRCMC